VPNQYRFGSELIVAPVTEPMDPVARLACVTVWLPEGTYFDFFNNLRLEGGRSISLWRPLAQIPVLAKAGAIVPLTGEAESRENGVKLPKTFEIRVYGGADGSFDLCEDDGETMAYENGEISITRFSLRWRDGDSTRFTLTAGKPQPFMPEKREFTIRFMGVEANGSLGVTNEKGEELTPAVRYDDRAHRLSVTLGDVQAGSSLTLQFRDALVLSENDTFPRVTEILQNAQIEYELKKRISTILSDTKEAKLVMSDLLALDMPQAVYRSLAEILLA
jgi:hypothetical protein